MTAVARDTQRRALNAAANPALAARLAARNHGFTGNTVGLAPGYVQGNLAILPRALADDFLRFANRNPKPCPVIGMTEPGSSRMPELGRLLSEGKPADIVRDPKVIKAYLGERTRAA